VVFEDYDQQCLTLLIVVQHFPENAKIGLSFV
jgi:hypothetical protein